MGNFLCKCNDKPFILATGLHRNHGYEMFTQSTKSSVIDIYHTFLP